MRKLASIIPTFAAIVVAIASFVLSFVALRDVAAQVQAVPASLAWLLPLVVDGGVLAASASLWSASYRQRKRDKIAYLTVGVLLGFSVVVNMSHAGPSPLAKAIAALPPIVLLACLELVAAHHREEISEAVTEMDVAQPSAPPPPHLPAPASFVPVEPAAPQKAELAPAPTGSKTTTREKVPAARTGQNLAEAIRTEFDRHLLAGGDPSDPRLASDIAARLDVTPAYVRRLIKPLREESLVRP